MGKLSNKGGLDGIPEFLYQQKATHVWTIIVQYILMCFLLRTTLNLFHLLIYLLIIKLITIKLIIKILWHIKKDIFCQSDKNRYNNIVVLAVVIFFYNLRVKRSVPLTKQLHVLKILVAHHLKITDFDQCQISVRLTDMLVIT